MAGIHGFVYIIIGLSVTLFSNYVYNKTAIPSLLLFFYLGLIFIAIGAFKLVKGFLLKDSAKPIKEKEPNQALAKMLNKDLANVDMNRTQQNHSMQQNQIIACQRCGTKHYANSNFCHICGYPLKKNI